VGAGGGISAALAGGISNKLAARSVDLAWCIIRVPLIGLEHDPEKL
jgi:hypothetical protein